MKGLWGRHEFERMGIQAVRCRAMALSCGAMAEVWRCSAMASGGGTTGSCGGCGRVHAARRLWEKKFVFPHVFFGFATFLAFLDFSVVLGCVWMFLTFLGKGLGKYSG